MFVMKFCARGVRCRRFRNVLLAKKQKRRSYDEIRTFIHGFA